MAGVGCEADVSADFEASEKSGAGALFVVPGTESLALAAAEPLFKRLSLSASGESGTADTVVDRGLRFFGALAAYLAGNVKEAAGPALLLPLPLPACADGFGTDKDELDSDDEGFCDCVCCFCGGWAFLSSSRLKVDD